MADDNRGRLVEEVADALTRGEEVEWDRCARLATPAERPVLENLRAFSGILAEVRGVASESGSPGTETAGYGGALVRRAVHALMAFAALWVATALAAVLWGWGELYREYGELFVFGATLLVGHATTACLFLFGGGAADRRTWLLGVYFLLKATLVSPVVVVAALRGTAPTEPFGLPAFGAPYVYPFLLAPAFLWAFARECPRAHRRTRLDDVARRMIRVCVGVACIYWLGGVAWIGAAQSGYLAPAVFWVVYDASFAVQNLLELAAGGVVVLRARTAPADEARRVALFGSGFLMFMGLTAAYDIGEVFVAGGWLANYRWSPAVALVELVRFPGLLVLWYSVLAVRVPHLREAVRETGRRLLGRGRLLAAAAGGTVAALGWVVAGRPERTVGALLGDPLVQALGATAGLLLTTLAARDRILVRLDGWLFPDTADQRQAMARAATALARAEEVAAVGRMVYRTAKRGCGAPAALLLAADDAHDFRAPDARLTPLPRDSALVHMLETAGEPVRVHPHDRASFFELLPPADAGWVAETGADTVVPLPGPGAELPGVLVAGSRLDGRIVRPVDVPFLETLAAAAGLAAARLRRTPEAGTPEPPPAQECPACRSVTASGEPPACDCGVEGVEAAVPQLLAAKYRLARRLGSGGMGAVYLARDMQLQRDVAVKTLAGVSVERLRGLKPEAWAMATVTHPAVAQIYGVESWRRRPFLVVELLAGGTLADRLRDGPLAVDQAVTAVSVLAGALEALHEAGYVHGDVKPSNIGLTGDGAPKLLDFGLARAVNDATVGGTVRYVSPEVLSGRPAGEADDVWALCVTLYEMLAGEHPFAGGSVDEVADRIRRRRLTRLAGSTADDDSRSALLAFAASTLTAARSARPTTARAFADALQMATARAR